jgi:hypothetical protein
VALDANAEAEMPALTCRDRRWVVLKKRRRRAAQPTFDQHSSLYWVAAMWALDPRGGTHTLSVHIVPAHRSPKFGGPMGHAGHVGPYGSHRLRVCGRTVYICSLKMP